jgi:hypothetical protein
MKFILLKSRGGDYMVVAENVAWLRTHENNQTKVGVVGGDSLLVAGSIEETADDPGGLASLSFGTSGCQLLSSRRCSAIAPSMPR